ncbi:hypothetical protein [Leifsonia sp. NCR5]|uniref:hypothetical protein n=1 Tax=Leifsonia sp. NCR5 TaxID=1978342 RepID=UPI00117A9275|nr:hypothetical protein [Leifsonia sp. NCR5]
MTTAIRRPLFSIAAAAGALCLALTGAASATGAPAEGTASPLSAADAQVLRATLAKFDVPVATQDELIARARAGQVWDASTPNAVPVSEERGVVKDGFEYDVKRFADGSVAYAGLEIPAVEQGGGPQGRAISQCRYQSGSGYSNATGCQIDGAWGTIFVGAINVGYTLVQGGSDQMIDGGYGFQRCVYPTSCSSPVRVSWKKSENGSAAYQRWQADVSGGYLGTWNVWVQLNVGGDRAWQTNS